MGNSVNYVLLAIFLVIAATLAYRFLRFRSLAGALFGAPVAATLGVAAAADSFHMPVQIRVHSLASATPYKAVGLERVAKALGHYRVMPVTLSHQEAQQLAELLLQASGQPPNNSFKPTPLRGAA